MLPRIKIFYVVVDVVVAALRHSTSSNSTTIKGPRYSMKGWLHMQDDVCICGKRRPRYTDIYGTSIHAHLTVFPVRDLFLLRVVISVVTRTLSNVRKRSGTAGSKSLGPSIWTSLSRQS